MLAYLETPKGLGLLLGQPEWGAKARQTGLVAGVA